MNTLTKRRMLAVMLVCVFFALMYGIFSYLHYDDGHGRIKVYIGTVTFIPENTACKTYEINKITIVAVACSGEPNILPFIGKYDTTLKLGDIVEVKAVRLDPKGATKYKMYAIRTPGTYVKKL